ncbi:MAG TPA: hypothetical protein VL484_04480 [Vicinamibacterales bacterium]|jgi:hypothetical protein|nr:hypothetical protein [Vicinamibacterales bacterium]
MTYRFRPFVVLSMTLLLASSAAAGPPLICHPFEIGGAKSLPWQGPAWMAVDPGYDANRVVDDTLALLTPDTPVLVRMETLRRATVYTRNDPGRAGQLLARLADRTAGKDSGSRDYALALFDIGYLTETFKQAAWISASSREGGSKFQPNPAKDGYAQITRAIALTGDPSMEFAAAIVASDRRTYGEGKYRAHLMRAVAGAPENSLLTRNLTAQFGADQVGELRRETQKSR